MINVTPVILCGGTGTRSWLLSRTGSTKLFWISIGKESFFKSEFVTVDYYE